MIVKDLINEMDYNESKTSIYIENQNNVVLYNDRSEWLIAMRHEDATDFYTKKYGHLMNLEVTELSFGCVPEDKHVDLYIKVNAKDKLESTEEKTPTQELLDKYPLYIIGYVRGNLGLEFDDTSMDKRILRMSPDQVFKRVVEWNGLLGSYDSTIKDWIKNIYKVNLGED
jgi:hypothetical protein